MQVRRYRKKPVVVEAIQFTEESKDRALNFVTCNAAVAFAGDRPVLEIQTLEGVMQAHVGDFIIKGTQGEFYPCKAPSFHDTFEEVDNNAIR